jgi:sigma-B regulation protein RsbU (phosphoserine phosphatase)
VGGDFFDFMPLDADILGVAIGDASGHGLPAALLVRDIVTGLRMGIEKDLKITPVFERLNRVIHRSRLSSRFVSLFYGELEANGSLVYVNAGHPPPLLFSRDGFETLAVGGTVVGPLPGARFRSGIARLRPGNLLVMCTDGILERHQASQEFGDHGLHRALEAVLEAPAEAVLDTVFSAAFEFGEGRPWEDDATVLVVRRKP